MMKNKSNRFSLWIIAVFLTFIVIFMPTQQAFTDQVTVLSWVADDICEIQRRAKDTARLIYEEAAAAKDSDEREKLAKWAARSESEGRIRAMISLARSEPGIVVRPSQLDADPWLLNCANGSSKPGRQLT